MPTLVYRDNFLEILGVVAKRDPKAIGQLSERPKNAAYASDKIQNDIIEALAKMVGDMNVKCKNAVRKLSFIVRYLDIDTATIFEHLVVYSSSISECCKPFSYIIKTLRKHKLDPTKIVSQEYDGTFVMTVAIQVYNIVSNK